MSTMLLAAALSATLTTVPAHPGPADAWPDLDPVTASKVLRTLPTLPEPVADADYRSAADARPEVVELGRVLFFDKELSGNRNISCATCHHPLMATADGLSLPVGEGGHGLASARDTGGDATPIAERVPRNAPHVYNLDAREFTRMFHDGRLEEDPAHPSGFRNPAGLDLPPGLESPLAAQAMFPVTSLAEMAGQAGENPLADLAAAGDLPALWAALADRLRAIPEYVDLFVAAYGDHPTAPIATAADITYVHAANAIGTFEAVVGRADDSPFDRYLRGDWYAMSLRQVHGAYLFYGEAGCAGCHPGPFQTDHDFHAVAVPQIGPGKGDGPSGHDDFGREQVTGDAADRYRFRTPTLRNVALTGPWGHDGAYGSLEGMVRHLLDPEGALDSYDPSQATLPSRTDLDAVDLVVHHDAAVRHDLSDACELEPRTDLTDLEVRALVAFLHALTDPSAFDTARTQVPERVPSGLPVYD